MHQIQFGWGAALDHTGVAYSDPPDSLAGCRGPVSKGKGREAREKGGKYRGGKGMGKDGRLLPDFKLATVLLLLKENVLRNKVFVRWMMILRYLTAKKAN